MTDVARLNKLELERLHLSSDYVNLMIELESYLNQSRLCLSKAKAIVGFSNASAGMIDLRDMEPTVRISFDKDKNAFFLDADHKEHESAELGPVNRAQKTSKQPKRQEEKPKPQKNYKPFGELEPQSAKQARVISEKAIQLVCELATVHSRIQQLKSKK